MKLSKLVGYLNLLQQQDYRPDYSMAVKQLNAIGNVVETHEIQLETFSQDLHRKIAKVETAFGDVQTVLDDLQSTLKHLIQHFEKTQYIESQRLYEEEMCFETAEYILNRKLPIDSDSNILLRGRLKNYTDWRLPGLIIRPGKENFIEDLVPLDPLYLVDHSQELLGPAMQAFTPEYQRRLRPYLINDYRDGNILWQLPNNQFGFVFAYNYLNYKPLNVVTRYLSEIFAKLRPGGVCLFTYNDCDWQHGVALSEQSFMCYTPGHAIRDQIDQLGFEITYQHRGQGDLTWMEIKRPGEIESIRGGQSLAKIIAIQ
jgi:SAM-dependent methyltransferase